jgi:hypothetical protein
LTARHEKPILNRPSDTKKMDAPVNAASKLSVAVPKRRIHWHVFLTHFPLSMFGGAFGFQILHLFMAGRIVGIETDVKMTVHQLAAKVRKRFVK